MVQDKVQADTDSCMLFGIRLFLLYAILWLTFSTALCRTSSAR